VGHKQEAPLKRRLAVVSIVVGALVVPTGARADLGDAVNGVSRALEGIAGVLARIRHAVEQTQYRLEMVYPWSTTQTIQPVFAPVRSMAQEIADLSREWRFHGETQRFWEGLFGEGARLGKSQWSALFGAPPKSFRADIDELMDATSVLGANVAASRLRATAPRHRFWDGLYALTRNGYVDQSAGLAERHMALGAAGLGGVLVEQGETLTAELSILNLRHEDNQYRKRLEQQFALDTYAGLATLAGGKQ
jgi:hypothetical protein